MTAWEHDRDWADQSVPDLEAVFARCAIRLISLQRASQSEDTRKATDFNAVTNLGPVAVRVRREDCRHRDLTLRYRRRPWGIRNARFQRGYEVDKILDGHARLYLYAWVRP